MADSPATKTRMTLAEFMALPESNTPTELIHGELIVSPTPRYIHQYIVFTLAKALELLAGVGTVIISPMDLHFDDGTVLQPDLFWVRGEGSKCQLGDDGYWHGPPDLVVEVLSPATAARDRGVKFEIYERHGVGEYWLVDPEARFIEVFSLQAGQLQRQGLYSLGEAFRSAILGDQLVEVAPLFPA